MASLFDHMIRMEVRTKAWIERSSWSVRTEERQEEACGQKRRERRRAFVAAIASEDPRRNPLSKDDELGCLEGSAEVATSRRWLRVGSRREARKQVTRKRLQGSRCRKT